jgi:disulfide bond formation protein DsbB
MKSLPSPRICNWLLAGLCILALMIVYYLDGILGLEPCPLCMTQRLFVVGSGIFSLFAAIHGPGVFGRRVYASLAALFAAGGWAVAARHVWLQHLPPEQVPACGPGLQYMLETLPFSETLELVLMGDGNCAEVLWTFLGLSIPEQALLLFSAMLIANLWQVWRK